MFCFFSRLPKHLERWFCAFFNSQAYVEFKNINIFSLGERFENLLRKMYLKWGIMKFESIWCTMLYFQFISFQDTLIDIFVQFSTSQLKQNSIITISLFKNQNWRKDIKKSHFASNNDYISFYFNKSDTISNYGYPFHVWAVWPMLRYGGPKRPPLDIWLF